MDVMFLLSLQTISMGPEKYAHMMEDMSIMSLSKGRVMVEVTL